MKRFKSFGTDLNAMFRSPQTPASQSPSINPRRIMIALMFVGISLTCGIVFGLLSGSGKQDSSLQNVNQADTQSGQTTAQDGSLVIHFKEGRTAGGGKTTRASGGTLVRVRLLNSLETFDSVPVFAQVVDYALGQSLYGWTLVGDASGDGNVNRIKMAFKLARNPQGSSALEIGGQALSLDGTLGVKAEKVEGFTGRALIGGAKAGGSSLSNSYKGSADLATLLFRALLQGLETEATSDLGSAYNRSTALKLDPGQEFFVQLTESF